MIEAIKCGGKRNDDVAARLGIERCKVILPIGNTARARFIVKRASGLGEHIAEEGFGLPRRISHLGLRARGAAHKLQQVAHPHRARRGVKYGQATAQDLARCVFPERITTARLAWACRARNLKHAHQAFDDCVKPCRSLSRKFIGDEVKASAACLHFKQRPHPLGLAAIAAPQISLFGLGAKHQPAHAAFEISARECSTAARGFAAANPARDANALAGIAQGEIVRRGKLQKRRIEFAYTHSHNGLLSINAMILFG